MKHIVLSILALFASVATMAQSVKSPDGNMVVNFSLDQGRPTYTVDFKQKSVVKPSHLGLQLSKGGADLMDGFVVKETKTASFDETWTPVWGEESSIRNNYKAQHHHTFPRI